MKVVSPTTVRPLINQHWLVQIVLRSISYFRKDLWLIVTLLLLIDRGIGAFQPSQRLADGDSSRYGFVTNSEIRLDSYTVSCPVRFRHAEPNFRNGVPRDDHQNPERYRFHSVGC